MASIDVGIHPDPAGIGTRRLRRGSAGAFSTLDLKADESKVSIFVTSRPVLGALYDALDEIRADMAQTASDQVPTEMADWPAMAAMAPGELMEIHGK